MGAENHTSITEFILVGLTSHRKTQILLFVVILTIYSLSIVGNLLIIILVRADSHLHTPMYFFLMNLAGLEICYISSTVPQMLFNLLTGNGSISLTGCAIQMHMIMGLGGTECILLSVMSYDRYLAICHPLLYAVLMGRWRQLQLASLSWSVGILLATIVVSCTFQQFFCGPNHINHFVCDTPVVLRLACDDTHISEGAVLGATVVLLVVPLSVILTSYALILCSVLQMHSAGSRRKAFSTCASHLAVVTTWFSSIISMYMRPQSGDAPEYLNKIAVFYIVVTPLLNPLIYTLRNKDVHEAAAKVLRRHFLEHKI